MKLKIENHLLIILSSDFLSSEKKKVMFWLSSVIENQKSEVYDYHQIFIL